MKKSIITLSAMLSLMSLGVKAQTTPKDSVEVNLGKALEIALTDNADIRVADKTIQTKRYAKKETISGLFPTISASASGTKNIEVATIVTSMGAFKMGQPFNYSLTGTAAMPLVAPQLWKSIQLNEEQVQLAVEEARASKVNTVASVRQGYYSLLLARDSYNALLATQRTAERNQKDTEMKYKVGSASEYDKLQADVQVAAIKPNVLQAQNGVKLAEMNLKVLMGVNVDEPIRFSGELKDFEQDLFSDLMNLKSNVGLEDNTALKQMDINRRILKMSETINRLGYIPTLALAFQAGWSSMPTEFNPFNATYFGSASINLSFSWTLFDGMQKYMKSKQNKLSLESLDIQRENVVRQLELAVNSSLNTIETSAEQVVSNKESVLSAEKAYSIATKRYEVGSGTMLEVTSSEQSLIMAKLQYLQSIYDFLNGRAELEKTLGKIVTDK